jgi:hypothetical protein
MSPRAFVPFVLLLGLAAFGMGAGCGGDDPAAPGGGGSGAGGTGGSGGSTCDPATCANDQETECRIPACMGEACGYMTLAEGTACSLGVCSPVGDCVECNLDADCTAGMCAGNQCIPDACANGVIDGDESDVDCGGPQCAVCSNGQNCNGASDCASALCDAGTCTACQAGQCATGEFCDAGACVPQNANGQTCAGPSECSSGNCVDGLCCDIACDGSCQACDVSGNEGTCSAHADGTDPESECGADNCNGAGLCRCTDGMVNGVETDTDCGGIACGPCPDGGACIANGDCSSLLCTMMQCVGACANNMQDPGETGLDCGGMNCPACADGLGCVMSTDCQSSVCSANVCQVPSCSDMVQNGTEPATDCGVSCPTQCPDTSACNVAGDCQSGVCTLSVCQAASCSDTIQNGQETDVDCGGPVCGDCAAGQSCVQPNDCVSGVCTGSLCACSPSLNPLDDGSGANGGVGLPDLVMSEISPGNYIELFNTTGAAITLGASAHWLCSPFAYAKLSVIAAAVTVPAGGYATVPWPAGFTDVNAGGEVMLYASAAFSTNSEILDFMCWGINPHGTRKSQAEAIGKWTGGCNAALSNAAIHRNLSTVGTTSADYDSVQGQTPMNCTP